MKFSQIKKICKDADECIIFQEGPMKWIGTRDAAYPLEDVDVTTASVKTLFDWQDVESAIGVVEKTLEDMGLAPDGVVRCDVESNGWEKLSRGITLFNGGDKILSFGIGIRALFVWEERVRPAIRKNEYLDFRIAYNHEGDPLVIVTSGMMVTGILRPMYQNEAETIIAMLSKMGTLMPYGSPVSEKRKKEEPEEIDGQIAMDEMLEEAKNDDGE